LLIPVLICFIITSLIKYEEEKLIARFGKEYEEYIHSVPGLIPGMRQLKKLFVIPLELYNKF